MSAKRRGIWSASAGGACFEACYAHARGCVAEITAYAPRDAELHRIAATVQDIQRRNFYQLAADVTHRGRYSHEFCMDISVTRDSPAQVRCPSRLAKPPAEVAAATDSARSRVESVAGDFPKATLTKDEGGRVGEYSGQQRERPGRQKPMSSFDLYFATIWTILETSGGQNADCRQNP